jgi:L-lactate dehydrogenase
MNPVAGLEGDTENWSKIHQKVVEAGDEVIKLKGHETWAIGLSCSNLASSLLNCSNELKAVSTMVKGLYGINKEVFLSLPCIMNCNGIASVVNLTLSDEERSQLHAAANLMDEIQKSIRF